ncbi:MAG: response regulator [Nitrospirota bacterium]|nr:response regulator [Nitrospirota bacterium]
MHQTTILIVDDEVEFASALAERLEIRGYSAIPVFSAHEVLSKIEAHNPDVVLLDLKMPDSDGIEVLRSVKKIRPSIAVIMQTGHGDPDSVRLAIESGAADYIMKPINIGELTKKIESLTEDTEKG